MLQVNNKYAVRVLAHNLSTSDMLPKSRSQAWQQKRAAIRSKINVVAKQLYELKYDQEYDQRKLKSLMAKGDHLTDQVCQQLKRVEIETENATAVNSLNPCLLLTNLESLGQLQRENEKHEIELSERSTEIEADSKTNASQKTHPNYSDRVIKINFSIDQSKVQRKIRKQNPKSEKLAPKKQTTRAKPSETPVENVLLFVFLLIIIIFLL